MDRSGVKLAIDTALVERLLVQFLHEEIQSAGFTRAVLGVSGGIDSAVVAVLAARALGASNVLGLLLPYRESNPQSELDGRSLCESIGIGQERIDISAMADGYISLDAKMDRLRRGNVFARCRMIVRVLVPQLFVGNDGLLTLELRPARAAFESLYSSKPTVLFGVRR